MVIDWDATVPKRRCPASSGAPRAGIEQEIRELLHALAHHDSWDLVFLTLDLPTSLQPGLYRTRDGWDMGHRPLAYLLNPDAAPRLLRRASSRGGLKSSVASFLVDNEAGLASFWWVGQGPEPLVVSRPRSLSEERKAWAIAAISGEVPEDPLVSWIETCREWRLGNIPQGARQPTDIAASGFRTRLSLCPPLEDLLEGYSPGPVTRCLPNQGQCACNERWGRGMSCEAATGAFRASQMPRAVVSVDAGSWLAQELPTGMHACETAMCAVVSGFDPMIDQAPEDFSTVYLAHLNASAGGLALFPPMPPGSSRLNAVLATESPSLTRAAFGSANAARTGLDQADIVVSYATESPGSLSTLRHEYERISFIKDPVDRWVATAPPSAGRFVKI